MYETWLPLDDILQLLGYVYSCHIYDLASMHGDCSEFCAQSDLLPTFPSPPAHPTSLRPRRSLALSPCFGAPPLPCGAPGTPPPPPHPPLPLLQITGSLLEQPLQGLCLQRRP